MFINYRKQGLTDTSPELNDLHIKHPNVVSVNLSYNNLTQFPMTLLQCHNILTLDLRKNKFTNINDVLNKVKQLHNLAEIKIDLTSSDQVQELLQEAQQILIINGKSTKEFSNNSIDIDNTLLDDISLNKSLPLFNKLFTSFQNKFQHNNNIDISKDFHKQFQTLINEEGTKINSLPSTTQNYFIASNVLLSEFNILCFFLENYIKHFNYLGNDSSSSNSNSNGVLGSIILDNLRKTFVKGNTLLNQLQPKLNIVNNITRKQLELSLECIHNLLTHKIECNNNVYKTFQDEKEFMQSKIDRLEKENKLITDKLIKTGYQYTDQFTSLLSNTQSISYSKKQQPLSSSHNTITNTINTNNNTNTNTNLLLATVGVNGAKTLTLNIMKETIKEIYQSKIDYDKKCIEFHLPRETMEQHMYNFFNKKYGLKNLVIEWASSMILGVKQYSTEDSEVCLFGKILRNEQEEESRFVLQKLKTTIDELLELHLSNKYGLKSRNEIKKMILHKKNDGLLLEDEWKSILKAIHQFDEVVLIEKKIMKVIKGLNEMKRKNFLLKVDKKTNTISREQMNVCERIKNEMDIPYKEFVHVVMEYQISYRDNYLKSFLAMFQKCDKDKNGVVNEEEFREIVKDIPFICSKGNGYVKELLEKVDPLNLNKITFSDVVSLFSSEVVEGSGNNGGGGNGISILDQICLDGQN